MNVQAKMDFNLIAGVLAAGVIGYIGFRAVIWLQNRHNQKVLIVTDEIFRHHITGPNHQESPERMDAIETSLRKAGFLRDENRCSPRQATEKELLRCHTENYLTELKRQIKALKDNESVPFIPPTKEAIIPQDFQLSKRTYEVALYAAGAPLTALELIVQGKYKRAFCIVRPPGHHAHFDTGSGFCVFNNVVITALSALSQGIKKVLIVDWDLHHGDGTMDLTEENPNIFYFSTHRSTSASDQGSFYPGAGWGTEEQTGYGKGLGTVFNCPIDPSREDPKVKIREAFSALVEKMKDFKPELVLISCGFDSHGEDLYNVNKSDPYRFNLDDKDFVYMTRACVEIANQHANGRIISVLEGGYTLPVIGKVSKAHVAALSVN
jgi:acetoin utilization deacetylase AcuC-like enzyme